MAGFHIERGTLPFKGFCLALEASTRSPPGRGMLRVSSGTSSQPGRAGPHPSALTTRGQRQPSPPTPSLRPAEKHPPGSPSSLKTKAAPKPRVWVGSGRAGGSPLGLAPAPHRAPGPRRVPPAQPGWGFPRGRDSLPGPLGPRRYL